MAPSAKSNNHQHQHPFELVTPFVGHLLADTDLPKQVTTASAAEMLQLYESMLRIRRMEVAADALYKARLIRGFCHLGIGQVQAPQHRGAVAHAPCRRRPFRWVSRQHSPKTTP